MQEIVNSMMNFKRIVPAALVVGIFSIMATGLASPFQQEFTDPENTYKLTLVGDWKAVSYNDAVGRAKTEFVYRDRSQGLLKVTREKLTGSVAELVRQEEENLRVYRAGFER